MKSQLNQVNINSKKTITKIILTILVIITIRINQKHLTGNYNSH